MHALLMALLCIWCVDIVAYRIVVIVVVVEAAVVVLISC